jgi:hypothetical protein
VQPYSIQADINNDGKAETILVLDDTTIEGASEKTLRPVTIALVVTGEGKYDDIFRSYESWTPFIFMNKTAIVKWYISDGSEVLLDIGRPHKIPNGQYHRGFDACIVKQINI